MRFGWCGSTGPSTRGSGRRLPASLAAPPRRCGAGCVGPSAMQASVRAIDAFGRERYDDTVGLLLPVRHQAHACGGSHAQRRRRSPHASGGGIPVRAARAGTCTRQRTHHAEAALPVQLEPAPQGGGYRRLSDEFNAEESLSTSTTTSTAPMMAHVTVASGVRGAAARVLVNRHDERGPCGVFHRVRGSSRATLWPMPAPACRTIGSISRA